MQKFCADRMIPFLKPRVERRAAFRPMCTGVGPREAGHLFLLGPEDLQNICTHAESINMHVPIKITAFWDA